MSGDEETGKSMRAELLGRVERYEQSLPIVAARNGPYSVKLAVPSKVCLVRALSYFDKEPETLSWIAEIPDDGVLFDVGANIGLYAIWAAATRRIRVFAFEPEAGNYATLNQNLRLNGLTELCAAFCLGLSDQDGFSTLYVGQSVVGQAGHQVGRRVGAGIVQGIATATLDHLVYEAGMPCPSHIKIDVDGIEPAIIRGAGRLLRDSRLKSVLIELSVKQPEHWAIVERMESCGFVKDEALLQAAMAKTTGVKYTGNVIFSRA